MARPSTGGTVTVEVVTAEEFAALARVEALEARLTAATTPPSPSPFLSVPEAAEWLRTSRQAIDDMLSAGKLARHKVGSRTLIARTDLEALVQRKAGRC